MEERGKKILDARKADKAYAKKVKAPPASNAYKLHLT